ncbi:MAG: hypothetical protein AAF555_04750 [Verrucomicrobiota bacterium]
MSSPERRPSEKETFNEVMNSWAEKQPFWVRLRHQGLGSLRPGILPLLVRIGKILALLLVLLLGTLHLFSKHLESTGFAEEMQETVRERLGAEEAHFQTFEWLGKEVRNRSFSAVGGPASFFTHLEAEGIRFYRPFWSRFQQDWNLKRLRIAELDVDLRLGGHEESSPENAPQELVTGGFGVSPRASGLQVSEIDVFRATFRWKSSDGQEGQIAQTALQVTRQPWGHQILCQGGVLQLGWLRELQLDRLHLEVRPEAIQIQECRLIVPGSETAFASLSGFITKGVFPEVSLEMAVENFSLRESIPRALRGLFSGGFDGVLRFSGSPNRAEGVAIAGDLRPTPGFQFGSGTGVNVHLLDALQASLGYRSFARFPVHDGRLQFESQGQNLTFTEFSLHSETLARIEGRLTVSPVQGDEEKELTRYVTEAELQIGVDRAALLHHPTLLQEFFPKRSDGFQWMEREFSGTLDTLTEEIARELLVAIQKDQASRR